VLEITDVFDFPPGSYHRYVIREVDGRYEADVSDPRDASPAKRLAPSAAYAHFVNRVDSLILHRLPSDTNQTLGPNQREICGDGFSLSARLTIAGSARTTGVRSCGDRSPGSAARLAALRGIVDSLARLVGPR
jgi:hypothetical protein